MFYLSPEGDRYQLARAFSYGEFQYGAKAATHPKFMSLGFTQVIVEQRPDDKFYFVSGPDDAGKYSSNPRDLDQLKQRFCGEQVNSAQRRLKDTDYLYARAAEQTAKRDVVSGMGAVAVPAAVVTNRDEIRAVCKSNCALIMATTSVEELEKLIKAPAQVVEDPEAEEPVFITNPEPHLEPLPTIDVSEYLTAELI